MLQSQAIETLSSQEQKQINQLITSLSAAMAQIETIDRSVLQTSVKTPVSFFLAPTHTIATNSSTQSLNIYYHPAFGKHLMNQSRQLLVSKNASSQTAESALPAISTVIEFIKAFDYAG